MSKVAVFVVALAIPVSGTTSPAAQEVVRKFDDVLARTGDVTAFTLNPAVDHVLFAADHDDAVSSPTERIHRADVTGSATAITLAMPVMWGKTHPDIRESADGTWAVFRVNFELFSARTDGSGSAIPLSASLEFGDEVGDFQLSPDGAWVVFRVGWQFAQLFSAPLDGSSPAAQLDVLPSNRYASVTDSATGGDYRISPDSSRVVYRSDRDQSEVFEMFVVPIQGGSSTKLSGSLVTGGDAASDFEIGPGGTHVYYRADAVSDGRDELFRVPLDGSTLPQRLCATPVAGGDVLEYRLSPDGGWVVYRADQDADEVFGLYSMPAGGGTPVRLDVSAPYADVEPDFAIAADSLGVAYRADQMQDDRIELFSVGIQGGAPLRRSGAMVTGGDVRAFRISTPTLRLVFLADRRVDGVDELFSVPIGIGQPVALHGPLPFDRDVSRFELSPDGTRVVFRADVETNGEFGLHVAPVDGSAPAQALNEIHQPGGKVQDFAFAAGGRVAYRARELGPAAELFSVPIDASTPSARLNSDLPPGQVVGDVIQFQVDSTGTRCAFVTAGSGVQVYTALLPGGEPVPLLTDYQRQRHWSSTGLTFSPDGRHLFFNTYGLSFEGAYWTARSDGSALARKIGKSLSNYFDILFSPDGSRFPFGGRVWWVERNEDPTPLPPPTEPVVGDAGDGKWSPDGSRIVYLRTQRNCFGCTATLLSVRTDGSEPAIVLSQDASPYSPLVVTDQYALFTGLQDLLRVPLDGRITPVPLNDPPQPSANVSDLALSPDRTRVAFVADHLLDESFELFTVPVDGSSAPVQISFFWSPGAGIDEFQFSPDSAWLVFRGHSFSQGPIDLLAAPSDGTRSAVRLNYLLGTAHDVEDPDRGPGFVISPDSRRVVYLADQYFEGRYELFSVPIDRSSMPVTLNSALPMEGDVLGRYKVSPDSSRVVYRADMEIDNVVELFSAPIDGPVKARKISGPLVFRGNVMGLEASFEGFRPDFRISQDSLRVLYLADQEVDERFELFSTHLRARDADGETPMPR